MSISVIIEACKFGKISDVAKLVTVLILPHSNAGKERILAISPCG